MIQNNKTASTAKLSTSQISHAEKDIFCGLDIHKSNITACIRTLNEQIRTFGTTTTELMNLKKWLYENRITHLAMESTGIYWKPVFNILQDEGKKNYY
ncbi:MAG: IS110 family transposase [Bacteroidetes bacterium]|nr:IS110 family transposase [Bacteroidota bacterium]